MKQFFKFMFASMLGCILSCILLFFLFFAIVAALVSSSETPVNIPSKSVLVIKLNEPVMERSADNPFSGIPIQGLQYMNSLGLDDIILNIKKAGDDPDIKGILLDLSEVMTGLSATEDIRVALDSFRTTGKFIVSYADHYSQLSYYLASVSDHVFLNPQGMMEWKGLDAQLLFFKGMFEKLDMEIQVIRHGKFKSAVEPFISDRMSPENKEQMHALVQSVWDHLLTGISASRHLPKDSLNLWAERLAVEEPTLAQSFGLVDSLVYRDGLIDWLHKKLEVESKKKLSLVNLRKYNDVPESGKKEISREKIAVIYANGDIMQGEGSETTIGADKISRAIRKARSDSSVKAIVLRINSPGGMMISSDIIWREVALAKKVKPVVASMGDYAASGGYYIACEANRIFAEPTTITGSIGVFSIIPSFDKTLSNKLGITSDQVMTHPNAGFISVLKPLTEYQKALLTRDVERSYKTFIDRVSKGRNLSPEKIDSIGQGRVWTGVQALSIGLVDEFGRLEKAIASAASLANLKQYRLLRLPEQKDPFSEFFEYLSGDKPEEMAIRSRLGAYYTLYEQLQVLGKLDGVQARLPYIISIQ